MWQCPLNCEKVKEHRKLAENLYEAKQHLEKENMELLIYRDCMDTLVQLSNEGCQILGIEQKYSAAHAVFMPATGSSSIDNIREVFLYRLPIQSRQCWLCRMGLKIISNSTAVILDWSSCQRNMGYGSMLMKHLILYLRSAGFKNLTGEISHVDFDHEEMLRHFYSKFGFNITDYPNRRALRLNLLDDGIAPLWKDDF